jgi:uncharacterized protein (TIGR02145 family)
MIKIIFFSVLVIIAESVLAQGIDSINFTCGKSTIQYAGQTYHTVQIGSQCWLVENINAGTMIDSLQKQTNNGVIEKYCFGDNTANCATYGGLYQWGEALQYQNGASDTSSPIPDINDNVKGICPSGWHIPAQAEFLALLTTISWDGNAMKAIGQGLGKGAGTDTSGFSALLGSFRNNDGNFKTLSSCAVFWSSMEQNTTTSYSLTLKDDYYGIFLKSSPKECGCSVRCLKD